MRMLLPVLGQLVARCQRSSLALITSPMLPWTTPTPEISAQTLPYTLTHSSTMLACQWPQLVTGGSSVRFIPRFKLEEVWPPDKKRSPVRFEPPYSVTLKNGTLNESWPPVEVILVLMYL